MAMSRWINEWIFSYLFPSVISSYRLYWFFHNMLFPFFVLMISFHFFINIYFLSCSRKIFLFCVNKIINLPIFLTLDPLTARICLWLNKDFELNFVFNFILCNAYDYTVVINIIKCADYMLMNFYSFNMLKNKYFKCFKFNSRFNFAFFKGFNN